jgi:DHA1 family inner membrane transport protein
MSRFALPVLAAAYFMLGVASMAVVGLVDAMAGALQVSRGAIATLLTVFALTYGIIAPLAQMVVGDWPRRRLILVGLAALVVGAILAATVQTYAAQVAARIVMGAGGALIGPMVSAAAASLAPPERQAAALSTVFSGMTIATVAGVPLANWAGNAFGWAEVHLGIAGCAAIVFAAVWHAVPAATRGSRTTPLVLWSVLRDATLFPAIMSMFSGLAAQFATYALIAVFMVERMGVAPAMVAPGLALFGVAGLVGNILAPRITRRLGLARTQTVALLMLGGLFVILAVMPPWPALGLVVLALWSVLGTTFMIAQQSRLVALAPARANIVLALNASAIYLGTSVGASLSAVTYTVFGLAGLPWSSLVLLGLCLGALHLSRRHGTI